MKIATLSELEKYLTRYLPTSVAQKFPGRFGLDRAKYLMRELGDPQNKLRIVHIAGTAGKTSTAYLISALLKEHGFKVGLHASPYIVSLNERFQVNNAYLEPEVVVSTFNELIPILDKMKVSPYGNPSYFEITIALAYMLFVKLRVDYCVIETGVGGMLDATNTVNRADKCAVITPIGMDHMDVLGSTIQKIATQKAAIIMKNNLVISTFQEKEVLKIISDRVVEVSAALVYLPEVSKISHIQTSFEGTKFTYVSNNAHFRDLKLGLVGEYQAYNAHLALEVVKQLGNRDVFELDEAKVRGAFASVVIPGRFEFKRRGDKVVILDGAHNEMKMRAFLKTLASLAPTAKHTFIIAFKNSKDIGSMLDVIIPQAKKIIITSFSTSDQDMIHSSYPEGEIASYLEKKGFTDYEISADPHIAFADYAYRVDSLVVTGSLYLIGALFSDFTAL